MEKDSIMFEMEDDIPNALIAHKYNPTNVGLHFHRNLEIYGVIDGEVTVTIAGESKRLLPWEMAVINCMEPHQYAIHGNAEIFFVHIGTTFLSIFNSLYRNKTLPRWLPNTEFNKTLYDQIEPLFFPWYTPVPDIPDIKKHAIGNNIIADIISEYGLAKGDNDSQSRELVQNCIQYIYEHLSEDITLESLAKMFYVDPKALSKKLSRCIGLNLKVFVNDLRMQRAAQLYRDPDMRGKTKKQIAQMCGFKNMETFYRVYNRNKQYFNLDD